jgi:hypothetical protein
MTIDTNKQPEPTEEVRSDLWASMSVVQLYKQQELVFDKLTKLRSLLSAGGSGSSSVIGLLKALQQASTDLTTLIEEKSTVKSPRKTDGQ